jgi:hypothetical protein
MKSFIELVVARHQEDMRWLRRVPASISVTIYNKGTNPPLHGEVDRREGLSIIDLPNEGREAHSYLTHFVRNYEDLAETTVFCQGHPFDHAPDFHKRLKALAEGKECPAPFLWYGFLDETDDLYGERLFVPWSKNPTREKLSTGKLYEELFCVPPPELFHFRGGAQFAVTREAAHRRERNFYERALKLSLKIPHAAHSLERIWDRFFGDPVINSSELGEEGVRYGKRIRRLESPAEE